MTVPSFQGMPYESRRRNALANGLLKGGIFPSAFPDFLRTFPLGPESDGPPCDSGFFFIESEILFLSLSTANTVTSTFWWTFTT